MAGRNLEVANEAVAVTPSDTADNAYAYFYVGSTGNVAVVPSSPSNASAVTFTNVPSGATIYLKVSKIMATNTTATGIVGLR